MNNVILPENISVGFFDAKNKYVNIDITKRRAVKIFEIELPIESGGISYIDDDKAPIEPTTLICAKPGQMRRTRLPFRCRYIHVMVTHGAIYDILISAPNYIKIGDYSEYKKIFSDMYEYYNRAESKAIIMLSALFLRLVYLIHKDSHNMPEVNGLSLGCNSLIQNAISYMKEKRKNETDEAYDIYIDKLNYLIYRDHKDYDENMTLTVCFFIKDKKMRIRTPDGLKKIYTNSESLNILNRRKKDLQKNNFNEVAIGVSKDLYKIYTRKTEDANTNIILIFAVIFIIGITMLIFLLTRSQLSEQEDKVRIYLDKLKKSNNAKEFFTESCIICLGELKSEKENKKNEESEKKELLGKDEVTTLECGHKFHRNCVADWLKKEQSCPFCKTKFDIIGNENTSKISSLNFSIILNEILRIQANRNLLNINEIARIRRIYYPQYNSNKKNSSKSHTHNKNFSS